MKTKFIPILKTKKYSEKKVLEQIDHLFNDKVIPYIEVIKPLDDPSVINIINLLDGDGPSEIDHRYFIEFLYDNNSLCQFIKLVKEFTKTRIIQNPIISLDIAKLKDEEIEDALKIVQEIQKTGYDVSVRFKNLPSRFNAAQQFGSLLRQSDYFILDAEVDDYDSLIFTIEEIKNWNLICNKIIFTDERPAKKTAASFKEHNYNLGLNTSVIEHIKKSDFDFDGFGSYCSAKNDLNENAFRGETYGLFLLYEFENNKFFSYRTKDKKIASAAFTDLKDMLSNNPYYDEIINGKLLNCPHAKKMLEDFFSSKLKGSPAFYISVGIVNYIEQIVNNLE